MARQRAEALLPALWLKNDEQSGTHMYVCVLIEVAATPPQFMYHRVCCRGRSPGI